MKKNHSAFYGVEDKKENENMKKKRKISGQARAFTKSLHKNG